MTTGTGPSGPATGTGPPGPATVHPRRSWKHHGSRVRTTHGSPTLPGAKAAATVATPTAGATLVTAAATVATPTAATTAISAGATPTAATPTAVAVTPVATPTTTSGVSMAQIFIRISIGSFVASGLGTIIWAFSIYQDTTPVGSANLALKQKTMQVILTTEVEHHALRVKEAQLAFDKRKYEDQMDRLNNTERRSP